MKKNVLLKDYFDYTVTSKKVDENIPDECLENLEVVVRNEKPWLYDSIRDLYISTECELCRKIGIKKDSFYKNYEPLEKVKYEIPMSDIHHKYGRFYSMVENPDVDRDSSGDNVVLEYQHDTYLYRYDKNVYKCYLNPEDPYEVSYIDHSHLERYELPELFESFNDYHNVACVKGTYAELYNEKDSMHLTPIAKIDHGCYFEDDGIYYWGKSKRYSENFFSNQKVKEAVDNNGLKFTYFVNKEFGGKTLVLAEMDKKDGHKWNFYLDKDGNIFVVALFEGLWDKKLVKLDDAQCPKILDHHNTRSWGYGTSEENIVWKDEGWITNEYINTELVKFTSGYAWKTSPYIVTLYTSNETFYACFLKNGRKYEYYECTTPVRFDDYIKKCKAIRGTRMLWYRNGSFVNSKSWKFDDSKERTFYSPELLVKVGKSYALKSEVEAHLEMFDVNSNGSYNLKEQL